MGFLVGNFQKLFISSHVVVFIVTRIGNGVSHDETDSEEDIGDKRVANNTRTRARTRQRTRREEGD